MGHLGSYADFTLKRSLLAPEFKVLTIMHTMGGGGEEEITLYFLTPMQCHQSSAGDPNVCDSDTDSRSLPNPAYVQPTRQPKHATKTATRQSNLHYCKQ